jgi:hypothetical protein
VSVALPRTAIVPSLDLEDHGKRVRRARPVALFASLPATQVHHLKDRGAELSRPQTTRQLVELLAERDFHAVVVDLAIYGAGALVKWLKAGPELRERPRRATDYFEDLLYRQKGGFDADADLAIEARARHRVTPFFVVLESERHYGIVVQRPEHSYYETGEGISLPDAVMCLDVGKLLLRGAALA